MAKQNFNKQIDAVRDTIVGKIPMLNSQVEQITMALLYKFMDDMDQESIDFGGNATFFSGDYEKYSWKRIMSNSKRAQERYNLYTEALEKFYINPSLPDTFREVFKNANVPYKDPETLTNFLRQINNNFDYKNSERLGDAYEYLLSLLGSQGDLGQFRTPRHLIDFIVDIVSPSKDDEILDPACGTAGFLISAYKYILASNKDENEKNNLTFEEQKNILKNITGYDIEPSMVRIAEMNLFLHGASEPKIYEYDTLTMDDRWNDKFDVILANPPFMTPTGGIRPHNKFDINASRSEVLFVDYIVNHMRSKGKAGIIIPDTILFSNVSSSYKSLRKIICENGLYAIVSLPAGVFKPYAKDVKTSILFFDKSYKTNLIYYITVNHDGYTLTDTRKPTKKNDLPVATSTLKKIKYCIEEKKEFINDFKINVDTIDKTLLENNDYILLANKYNNIRRENTKYDYKKLGIFIEENKNKAKEQNFPVWSVSNKIGFVDTEEFHSEKVASSDIKNYKVINKNYFAYNPSRINVGSIALNKTESIGCVSPMYVSFKIIKPEELNEEYLLTLLKSDEFKNIINNEAYGAVRKQLRFSDLKNIEIPVPSYDEQLKIANLIKHKNNEIALLNKKIENVNSEINKIIDEVIM